MGLRNACNTNLSQNSGTLPDMTGALSSLFQMMTFSVITKTIVNYQVVENPVTVTGKGVRQPMKPQDAMRKPEGVRSWRWETIHCLPDLILKIDDIIVFAGVKYRVDAKTDWKEYGYVVYDITQDFTP